MNFNSDTDVRECDDIREELQPYLLSQYSASPTISKILKDFRTEIDAQPAKELFIKKIMDIDTAEGVGLDVWGNILNIGRTVTFQDGTKTTLDDTHYRKLLMYKALANITDASLATLNRMMPLLFDGVIPRAFNRNVPATLNGMKFNTAPMHVVWVLDGDMSELDLAIFAYAGTLSLGAGVGWSVVNIQDGIFGFDGSELNPFNQGTFINSGAIIVEPGTEGGAEVTYYSVIISQRANETISVVATKDGVTHTYTESFSVESSGWQLTILCEPIGEYLAGNLIINGIERTDGQVTMMLNSDITVSATEAEQGRVVYANGTIGWYSFGWAPSHWIFYTDEECTTSISKDQLRGKLVLHDVSGATAAGRYRGQCLFGSDNKVVTSRCEYVTEIKQNVHTGEMTTLNQAFNSCFVLKKVDLSDWDVKSATDMSSMFAGCSALVETGDISHWNVSSLLNASAMFESCVALKSVDLSHWATPSLTNVGSMFFRCSALQVIDISGWDTSNITNVGNMVASTAMKYVIMDSDDIKFSGNLAMPDANNNVKYLVRETMVSAYKSHANWSSRASRIDAVTNYDIVRVNGQITVTPKEVGTVVYMNGTKGRSDHYYYFYSDYQCTNAIDKSTLTGKVTVRDLSNGLPTNGEGITGGETWFDQLNQATEVDLSSVNVSKKTTLGIACNNCNNIRKITGLNNWYPEETRSLFRAFASNPLLADIGDISHWRMPELTVCERTFYGCDLRSIDLHDWYTPNLLETDRMFEGNPLLTVIDVSGIDTRNAIDTTGMFTNCPSLQYLIIDSLELKLKRTESYTWFLNTTCKILVPRSKLNDYKTFGSWSYYANQFYAIEDFNITRSNGQITVTPKEA